MKASDAYLIAALFSYGLFYTVDRYIWLILMIPLLILTVVARVEEKK